MKCDSCKAEIAPGDEREHLGKMICEDCYMEALSPMKACDPWAVHSAKTFEAHSTGTGKLTPLQMRILEVLKTEGPLEPTQLQAKLNINLTFSDLQREFATLRHMEKTRAEKRGDQVVWRLW